MSYLLDKKIKRNKIIKYTAFIIILVVLVYFRYSIFSGFSYVSHIVFRPILTVGNVIGEKLFETSSYFYSKKYLSLENENLKNNLNEMTNRMSNYNSVLDENLKLKEILERKIEKSSMILATILSKPNQSPYDTLIIDIGAKSGIEEGQKVFASGDVPIGYIGLVYPNSAKVVLFSNPGEKIEGVVSGGDTFIQIVGRGGGNFEIVLPRDFVLEKGTEVVLPGIIPYTIAIVESTISDPRDSFQKVLLTSPVNIQELKFVEVVL